jgi:hypothetical protein
VSKGEIMSTRSAIIAKINDRYQGIYCHFDGYIAGVGKTLQKYYNTAEKVQELIALGDISSLDKKLKMITRNHSFNTPDKNVTVAYHRDRGDDWKETKPRNGKTVESVANRIGHNSFVYVFENGEWTCNGKKF